MPQSPDARAAILDAAERLFVRQGFDATTIKQIAADAGVNSALLYYYFESKETLYRETLRRLFGSLVAGGTREMDVGVAPEEGIRRLVAFQAQFLSARPDAPRLIARELVDHEAAHAEAMITDLAANVFQRLCDLIRQGQREGAFRADVRPELAAISTIAQVVYFLIARPAVARLLGHGAGGIPPETIRDFAAHAADFALAALRAPAPPTPDAGTQTTSRRARTARRSR